MIVLGRDNKGEGETLVKRDWEKVARGAGC